MEDDDERRIQSVTYWKSLCPFLHLEDSAFCGKSVFATSNGSSFGEDHHHHHRIKKSTTNMRLLREEGYCAIGHDNHESTESLVNALAKATLNGLIPNGWQATFMILYDEVRNLYGETVSNMSLSTHTHIDVAGVGVNVRKDGSRVERDERGKRDEF